MQEVSSVRSTKRKDARFNPKLELPLGKEQIQRKKLHPQLVCAKEHLSDEGFNKIVTLRDELRALGKKAKTYHGTVREFDKEIE